MLGRLLGFFLQHNYTLHFLTEVHVLVIITPVPCSCFISSILSLAFSSHWLISQIIPLFNLPCKHVLLTSFSENSLDC